MRVLHIYSGNLYGGIEAILATLARHGGSGGATTEFALCFEGPLGGDLRAAGARVHELGEVRVSRPQTVRRARRALAALLASGAFDRVVCHAAWAYAIFAGTVRRAGIPLVAWVHDVLHGRHWTERWAARTPPDLIICNSHFTSAGARALFGPVPLAVVYAPVDMASDVRVADVRSAIRAELRTARDAVVVVQASRLERWKGHEALLHALSALRERSSWTCWIVGGAQRPREREYLASLRALASGLGIADRVRFAGERHDMQAVFAAADIHCQPNTAPEPFGIAFVEALAAGLPVVTTALGAATEIVDDRCGRVVAPGDRGALVTALDALIRDGASRRDLGAAGRARARELCDPGVQIRRMTHVLEGMTPVPVRA